MPDWILPLVLVGAVAAVWTRHVLQGDRPQFARVDRDGGSRLLSKRVQAVGYAALQPLGLWLARSGVSANAITWTTLVLGAAAGVCLAHGRIGLGATLGAAGFVGDALDGFVARHTGTASDAGEVLAAAIDRYVEFAWLGGLALHWRHDAVWLAWSLVALLGAWSVSYATAKAEALHRTVPRGTMRRVERCVWLTGGAVVAALLAPWQPTWTRLGLPSEWPLRAVVLWVAVLANVSAVHRLGALIDNLRRP